MKTIINPIQPRYPCGVFFTLWKHQIGLVTPQEIDLPFLLERGHTLSQDS